MPVASNAEAARRARDEEGTAALAGEAAAKVYGLRILFSTVEDRDDNTTRFVVVGRKLFPASGKDKTSVLVSANESEGPGVLLHLLGPLSTPRRQHDANRIAALAQAEVGLRLLLGSRRPCRG